MAVQKQVIKVVGVGSMLKSLCLLVLVGVTLLVGVALGERWTERNHETQNQNGFHELVDGRYVVYLMAHRFDPKQLDGVDPNASYWVVAETLKEVRIPMFGRTSPAWMGTKEIKLYSIPSGAVIKAPPDSIPIIVPKQAIELVVRGGLAEFGR